MNPRSLFATTLTLALLLLARGPTRADENAEGKGRAKVAATVTFSVKNWPVQAVLRRIASDGDAKLIVADDVKGLVTIGFEAVPWHVALERVAAAAGLEVVKEKHGVLRVEKASEKRAEAVKDTAVVRRTFDISDLAERQRAALDGVLDVMDADVKVEKVYRAPLFQLLVTGPSAQIRGFTEVLRFLRGGGPGSVYTMDGPYRAGAEGASFTTIPVEPGTHRADARAVVTKSGAFYVLSRDPRPSDGQIPWKGRIEADGDRPFVAGSRAAGAREPASLQASIAALHDEIRALRAEVREIKAILEREPAGEPRSGAR